MSYGISISGTTGSSAQASSSNSLLASDLSSSADEQQQLTQLVQKAQTKGTSASDLLAQIENVIDTSQPSQLYQYLDASTTSTSAYTSNGQATTSTTSSLINTSA